MLCFYASEDDQDKFVDNLEYFLEKYNEGIPHFSIIEGVLLHINIDCKEDYIFSDRLCNIIHKYFKKVPGAALRVSFSDNLTHYDDYYSFGKNYHTIHKNTDGKLVFNNGSNEEELPDYPFVKLFTDVYQRHNNIIIRDINYINEHYEGHNFIEEFENSNNEDEGGIDENSRDEDEGGVDENVNFYYDSDEYTSEVKTYDDIQYQKSENKNLMEQKKFETKHYTFISLLKTEMTVNHLLACFKNYIIDYSDDIYNKLCILFPSGKKSILRLADKKNTLQNRILYKSVIKTKRKTDIDTINFNFYSVLIVENLDPKQINKIANVCKKYKCIQILIIKYMTYYNNEIFEKLKDIESLRFIDLRESRFNIKNINSKNSLKNFLSSSYKDKFLINAINTNIQYSNISYPEYEDLVHSIKKFNDYILKIRTYGFN